MLRGFPGEPMDVQKGKSALTVERVTDWWETEITDTAPGVIRIRGYAIEDLIGRVGFAEMIWLTLRGELPTKAQAQLFEAVLVSAVDHGPQAPSIAIARMAATCGVGINGAMASGINALGDVHGGAGQQCMELIADIDRREQRGTGRDIAVRQGLETFREREGGFVPGFGHRFHAVDPRAMRLSELIREAAGAGDVSGRYLAIGEAVQHELAHGKTRPPTMNVDGVTAVMLSELGFPSELGRGIFILSRSVGICAHAVEQSQKGERIKGPTPPEAGFRYRGRAPRSLPNEVKDRIR
jgi:citrate synthase